MSVSVNERGVSQQLEARPFGEVSPEEIARASGGAIRYRGGKTWCIDYDKLGVVVELGSSLGKPMLREITYGEGVRGYPLKDTMVILGERVVTFVEPVRRHLADEVGGYGWIRISEGEGFSRIVRGGSQMQVPQDNGIIVAAKRAEMIVRQRPHCFDSQKEI